MLRKLFAAVVFLAGLAFAPSAFAQCIGTGLNEITCFGNSNGTMVIGSTGNDTFRFAPGVTGQIVIASGGGADTVDFSSFTAPATVDLASPGYQTVAPDLDIWWQGFDTAGSTHTVQGGTMGDTLSGGAGDDTLIGGSGDDTLTGRAGADVLNGDGGADTRADTALADCAGDTLNSVETDACAVPVVVPTLSEWAMILFGTLLAGLAAVFINRRRMA